MRTTSRDGCVQATTNRVIVAVNLSSLKSVNMRKSQSVSDHFCTGLLYLNVNKLWTNTNYWTSSSCRTKHKVCFPSFQENCKQVCLELSQTNKKSSPVCGFQLDGYFSVMSAWKTLSACLKSRSSDSSCSMRCRVSVSSCSLAWMIGVWWSYILNISSSSTIATRWVWNAISSMLWLLMLCLVGVAAWFPCASVPREGWFTSPHFWCNPFYNFWGLFARGVITVIEKHRHKAFSVLPRQYMLSRATKRTHTRT